MAEYVLNTVQHLEDARPLRRPALAHAGNGRRADRARQPGGVRHAMTHGSRQMRLTERHVALCKRDIPDPGILVNLPPGFRPATDDDYAENVAAYAGDEAAGPVLALRHQLADLEARDRVRREADGRRARLAPALLPRLGLSVSRQQGDARADDGARPRRELQGHALPPARRGPRSGAPQAHPPRDEHGPVRLPLALHRCRDDRRSGARA